jgi:hypothetical protein
MRVSIRAAICLATAVGAFSAPSLSAQELSAPTSSGTSGKTTELVAAAANLSKQATTLNQNQWIRIADSNLVRGSVATLVGSEHLKQPGLKVDLVLKGKVAASATTDDLGNFLLDGVQPGAYSLVVRGENQLAVCALTILSKEDGAHLKDRITVRTISPATSRVSQLLRSHTMPEWTLGADVATDPIGASRLFPDSCEIMIDSQRGIHGTLSRANASVDLSGTVVYLTRDGREVARTRAASNGDYRFENITEGGYGLVASGPEGIAAVGFCAVASDYAAVKSAAGKLVSQTEAVAAVPAMNVELASPDCCAPEVLAEPCMTENAACCPTMGGGCGVGGGGGGGGAGMGGWGALAAIGGLTALGIIAADNNESAPVVVSPVTP